MTGLHVLFVALMLATGFGLWRRITDGTMRAVRGRPGVGGTPDHTGSGEGSLSAPDGRKAGDDALTPAPAPQRAVDQGEAVPPATSAAELGRELGERATLLQFSSAFCAPCRATRAVLADVARVVPGVAHLEVDAESNLALVRRLDIRRTPTVLVLDGSGRIRRRAVGAPRKGDVLAALSEIL